MNSSADILDLKKPELEICFIPIICSAPLIYAYSHGYFAKNGLSVNLRQAPGWSGIKEFLAYGKVDAAHRLDRAQEQGVLRPVNSADGTVRPSIVPTGQENQVS